jgi:hypothetical protein
MCGAELNSARFLRQTTSVVCLFLLAGGGIAPVHAQSRQPRPAPQYLQLGKPDQEKGRAVLEQFRRNGVYAGDNYFEFELRVMPRRGKEKTVPGRLWTGDAETGPVSRYVLFPGVADQEQRVLVQNGPSGGVWIWRAGSAAGAAEGKPSLFESLAGTDVTPFDLQMAFLYWPEFVYEGVTKLRGRPADTFLLYPPSEISAQAPTLAGVRVYLDAQYGAPVQAEYIGAGGKPMKTVSVIDLKKVGEQWVVKSIDFRDDVTRNKTRFSLLAAAVGLDHGAALFAPDMLKESIRPPPQDRIQVVAP